MQAMEKWKGAWPGSLYAMQLIGPYTQLDAAMVFVIVLHLITYSSVF